MIEVLIINVDGGVGKLRGNIHWKYLDIVSSRFTFQLVAIYHVYELAINCSTSRPEQHVHFPCRK